MSKTRVPEQLLYTETHEWLLQEGDITTVGITDYAQAELGDIVFVELPEVGQVLHQGEAFGTIEAVKTVEDLVAPASGEVVEVNESLAENAEQVNSDPYGAGWMIRIRREGPAGAEGLLTPEEYSDLVSGS
ncbi:MAG: glycine cleavage system protein GcvH [Candidatus Latescibacterota bacterium]